MSRSLRLGNHRFLLALIALPVLGLSLAPAATASTISTDCAGLQGAIDTASTHTNEVVVLTGMCEATNLKVKTGVTIPAASNITLEGAAGTTSGFDGNGVEKPLLHSAGPEAADTIAIRNLTFQHADITGSSGAALQLTAAHVTLAGDTFVENTLHGFGGGAVLVFLTAPGPKPTCQSSPAPSGVTLTNSVFRANKVIAPSNGGGGALDIAQICRYPQSVIEGNVFESNTLEGGPASTEALGGAFSFEPGDELPTPLLQRGNVFDSNRIVSTSTTANFGGGGEWTEGTSLTSVGDRFSRNTIPGAGAAKWSWGGGLGIINSSCEPTAATESTLEDAVVTGNSIAGGSGALGGGGIYVGCSPVPTHPNHLTVFDSTITQNSVVGDGVGGIEGNPGDQLRLINSIVSGDTSAETGGFNGTGGSLSASFSDVCAAGGASPLPGEGNICANPLLANNGNAASFDVHETSASPTIDAGSNALVPSGLSTDAFGTTRILAGHAACGVSFPAVVDIGAEELQSASPSCPAPVTPRPPVPGLTHYISRKVSPTGIAVKLSCSSTDGLGCSGTIFLTTNEILQGKRVIAVGASHHTRGSVRLGQAPFSLAAGSTATFTVKLNSIGLKLLRRFHAISAFMLANEVSPTSTPFIFLLDGVRFSQPKHKSKKHKSRHAKRRH